MDVGATAAVVGGKRDTAVAALVVNVLEGTAAVGEAAHACEAAADAGNGVHPSSVLGLDKSVALEVAAGTLDGGGFALEHVQGRDGHGALDLRRAGRRREGSHVLGLVGSAGDAGRHGGRAAGDKGVVAAGVCVARRAAGNERVVAWAAIVDIVAAVVVAGHAKVRLAEVGSLGRVEAEALVVGWRTGSWLGREGRVGGRSGHGRRSGYGRTHG